MGFDNSKLLDLPVFARADFNWLFINLLIYNCDLRIKMTTKTLKYIR